LSAPIPGRPPALSIEQRQMIPELRWHGADAYGFHGSAWTCGRVAKVIGEEFGVAYTRFAPVAATALDATDPHQARHSARRAGDRALAQRDLAAIAGGGQDPARDSFFVGATGFYLLPSVVKTYAPCARTPVLHAKLTRYHLSVMDGMTPAGRTYTLARQESLNGLHPVELLVQLNRVAAQRLLVVWDGSPIHRRTPVREFVADTRGKVRLEALPGYAPDLNPWDEGGWHHLKNVEMRNLICKDLEELHEEFHLAVHRLRQKAWLAHSFFNQAGLTL
jgi:transposase